MTEVAVPWPACSPWPAPPWAIASAGAPAPGPASGLLVIGHGATVTENAHASGYDCGACAGNDGAVNPHLLAAALDDAEVRRCLAERGIVLPHDTVAVAGVHDTTRDVVRMATPDPADGSWPSTACCTSSWATGGSTWRSWTTRAPTASIATCPGVGGTCWRRPSAPGRWIGSRPRRPTREGQDSG